ncbi:hypothetical protein IU459_28785 [Nocardia amamiensis]|uniref:DUF805 domain-containing protein n=1 Tax=Nocardia amamiensis TaxID=404578 RepID=A0ABS0CY23_9NOCA|nr:hypothetical protein [Nocardia amamiensis]MBF6301504.1 hypothetical protein [Nocardia amamiensis]
MGQPFQPGPMPHNPWLPTDHGWGASLSPPVGQPVPGYWPGGGRGAADAIAAAASALAAILYLVRRIWLYTQYGKFFWYDVVLVITVVFALVAAILLLTASKPATARIAGGIAAGMVFAPNASYVFGAFDRSFRAGHGAWQDGGWLSIPATLIALIAIGALLAAASSVGPQQVAGAGFRPPGPQPPNQWPYPPTGQPPTGYPSQYQPPQ